MQTYTANEAKTRFGEFLDRVQREPVRVMRHERVVGVMVSAQDYAAMRAVQVDQLDQALENTVLGARVKELAQREGLTAAEVVERALRSYEHELAGREPAADFYARINRDCATEIDLEAIIGEGRLPHAGIEL